MSGTNPAISPSGKRQMEQRMKGQKKQPVEQPLKQPLKQPAERQMEQSPAPVILEPIRKEYIWGTEDLALIHI